MAVVISVSITKEQKDFLDEMQVSPSELLQRSITDMIQSHKINREAVLELQRKLQVWIEMAQKQREFIEKRGILEEYLAAQ